MSNKICEMITTITKLEPCRVTKSLDNGNLAILQIVNPEEVPEFTRWLRSKKGRLADLLSSAEAAIRVGTIVFRNSMNRRKNG